jgi:hypothetical protein
MQIFFLRTRVLCIHALISLVLFQSKIHGVLIETKQSVLPVPFSQFENLCFDPRTDAFIAIGRQSSFTTPIDLHCFRPYSFKSIEVLPLRARPTYLQGTTLFLFESEGPSMILHFFHLLEHIVGLWNFNAPHQNTEVTRIVLAADGTFDTRAWEGSNQINRHLLKALFPNALVETWPEFKKNFSRRPIIFQHVLTSDRALTFRVPFCRQINKMLGTALPYLDPEALNTLAETMHSYAATSFQPSTRLRITYSKRNPPRTLAPPLEEELLAQLSSLPYVELTAADFASLSFKQQVNLIGNTDLLLGVHGNGLSHILFLPPEAAVIELFPKDSLLLDYRLFADARGLDYYGIIENRGLIDRETAYRGCFGSPNHTLTQLDIPLITSLVQATAKKRGLL